jgi:hypothetical protein
MNEIRDLTEQIEYLKRENERLTRESKDAHKILDDLNIPKVCQDNHIGDIWLSLFGRIGILIQRHQAELIQANLLNQRLTEAVKLAVNKQHAGDCEFSDKSDEGCWLCAKAMRDNWPTIQEALASSSSNSKKASEALKTIESE